MFLLKICTALERGKIRYALVGGYAVALQGAVRGTVDIDLALSFSLEAFEKAEKIFLNLGLKPRLPVDGRHVFRFRKEYIKNRNLIAWSFYDPSQPLNQLDVVITEDADGMKTDTLKIQGVNIRVASKRDLIKMKRRAGRPQDLEDMKSLEELLKK